MSNDNKFTIPKFNESQQNIEIKNEPDYMSCVYNTKSPSARTILITNNYTQTNKQSSSTNNSSSITIFTHDTDSDVSNSLPLDGINILINNHFNESQLPKTNMPSTVIPIPNGRSKDVEISMKTEFSNDCMDGKKLFSKNDDVFVMQSDERYHLGTIVETMNHECLVKFGDNSIEWFSYSKLQRFDKQEVDILCILCKDGTDFIDQCYKCGRGYHMKCAGALSGIWFCKRRHKNLVKIESGISTSSLTNFSELPYDFNSLTWNSSHKRNDQDTYCYCGRSGCWYKQMINCIRCRQWFHGDCIKSLINPLYCGDRFYAFVCSMCNHGTEYLQRLQMKIEEVVELILFNLTVYQNKQFYDVFKVIIPFARDNWCTLQLSPNMANMSFTDIRDQIIRVLNGRSSRFICRDRRLFGLKTRVPPIAPTITLPAGPVVTENYIREQCGPNILLLPKSALTEYIATDLEMNNFMTGEAYKKELSSSDEYEDSKFESEDDDTQEKATQVASDASSNSNDCIIYSDRSRDASDDAKSNSQKVSRKRGQKRKMAMDTMDTYDGMDESSDDNSSRSTLDVIIPPPKDFHGFNNPFVNENAKQCTESNSKSNVKLANNVPSLSLFGNTCFTPTNNQIRYVNIVKRRLSARDIVVGPNQEVKRRKNKRRSDSGTVEVISTTPIHAFSKSTSYLPFRTDLKDLTLANVRLPQSQQKESSSSSSTSTSQATTPTEQLCSMPTNVHGRRLRKREQTVYTKKSSQRLSNGNVNGNGCNAPISSTNTSVPSTSTGVHNACASQNVSINDLHSFFSAANRIASREKAVIKGKRISEDGRLEYLIEWGDEVS